MFQSENYCFVAYVFCWGVWNKMASVSLLLQKWLLFVWLHLFSGRWMLLFPGHGENLLALFEGERAAAAQSWYTFCHWNLPSVKSILLKARFLFCRLFFCQLSHVWMRRTEGWLKTRSEMSAVWRMLLCCSGLPDLVERNKSDLDFFFFFPSKPCD